MRWALGHRVGKPNHSVNLSPLLSMGSMRAESGLSCPAWHPCPERAPARCAVNVVWARGDTKSEFAFFTGNSPTCRRGPKERKDEQLGPRVLILHLIHTSSFICSFFQIPLAAHLFQILLWKKCQENPLGVAPEPSAGWEAGEKEKQAGTTGIMKLPLKATVGRSPGQPLPCRELSAPSWKSKEEKQTLLRGEPCGQSVGRPISL